MTKLNHGYMFNLFTNPEHVSLHSRGYPDYCVYCYSVSTSSVFRRPYPSDDRDIGRVQRRRQESRIRRNVSLVRIHGISYRMSRNKNNRDWTRPVCRLSCSNGNACVRTRNIRAPPVVIRFCLTAQFGKAHDVSHNTFLSCKAHVHVVQYRPGAHCSHIGSGSGYCVGDLNCV
jgi:hypothetical protein